MAVGDKCKDCGVILTNDNYVKRKGLCRGCLSKKSLHTYYTKTSSINRDKTICRKYGIILTTENRVAGRLVCNECNLIRARDAYKAKYNRDSASKLTKICPTCKKEYLVSDLPSSYICKECARNRRDSQLPYRDSYINRCSNIDLVKNIKESSICSHCGEDSPATLNFHHRDPSTKLFNISDAAASTKVSEEQLIDEISKCDVLCANCHNLEHLGGKYAKQNVKYNNIILKYLTDARAECVVCKDNNFNNLVFHHRDPSTKIASIARLKSNRANYAVIIEEMDKCDIMCHNCHRKLHAEQLTKESVNKL